MRKGGRTDLSLTRSTTIERAGFEFGGGNNKNKGHPDAAPFSFVLRLLN